MENYLKLFENHNQYIAFTQTEEFVKPNVSHCIQENEVHYNPLPIRGTVDFGLSVKWAKMNVGATSETDFGNLYSWGGLNGNAFSENGTIPSGTKQYAWDDYELSNGGTAWNNPKLTKYCPAGKAKGYYANGFTGDTKVTLEDVDDAAFKVSNGQYRMPTKANLDDLCSGTTNGFVSGTMFIPYTWNDGAASTGESSTVSELSKFNGVNGMLFWRSGGTTINEALSSGEYLFLPACDNANNGYVNAVGQWGYYWSGSLNETNPSGGWLLYFGAGRAGFSSGDRCRGLSIRGVLNQ